MSADGLQRGLEREKFESRKKAWAYRKEIENLSNVLQILF